MTDAWRQDGRINQKRRTRAAILAAARNLLRQGQSPTVAEAADAALVSRATAYRYFPTQEYLLAEAALSSVPEKMDQVVTAVEVLDDAQVRLDTVVQAIQERTVEQEQAFRTLLRLALDQPFTGISSRDGPELQRRGGRRIEWIERALAPVWERLDEPAKEQLVGALSLCMGVEALVVLRDVCGYSPERAVEICRWAAQAILRAGLDQATNTTEEGYAPPPSSDTRLSF
ncbi:MAG TPA: TetR/AcrR family transcriptional regulator [Candidatus Sulfotelmatobacter sp.]|nr:TetR/AcrR family transcriptional regulator [Candidatus Sulfotelmatobacter sp.]